MHPSSHYERIIEELCGATGAQRWHAHEEMNLSIDDSDVGLFHRSIDEQEVLHVFIDLGFVSDPQLEQHLLRLNSELGMEDFGRYALHPEYGSVVYRLSIPLDERIRGDVLPALITRARDTARVRVIA